MKREMIKVLQYESRDSFMGIKLFYTFSKYYETPNKHSPNT
jgi:hypothetical protein